jgi:endoribonuclease Dicer
VYSVFQHERYITSSDLTKSAVQSAYKKIARIFDASIFCLEELGIWLALKVLALLLL